MKKLLDQINKPNDIKKLSIEELNELAKEIRAFLLEHVSETGGHLASNLGIVELTIALLYYYDFDSDKIIFDVGHQSYVYKILTGRKDEFVNLRKHHGLSGFPKREESPYDFFDTGHSSNSISACLGLARARDLKKEDFHIIDVIGDGAFTGGMVYEALNDLGGKNSRMLVILNDNQMSISKNVGGLSNHFNRIRLTRSYNRLKARVRKTKNNFFIRLCRKLKNSFKSLFFKPMFFESLGIRYIGPIDGHNIKELIETFKLLENVLEPVVLHIVTVKGEGYAPAMNEPSSFHAVGEFDLATGKKKSSSTISYSSTFGASLVESAKKDDKIVAITAAMADGTGLSSFKELFPERFFDVGITEEHAVTLAAGLALGGLKPVFAVYSTFLQRGFDQIIIDVCMQNLPVIFAIDRAGLVGKDGKTHQGVFDLSFLRMIPNIQILAPKCPEEIPTLLNYALKENGPIAIRYPKESPNVSLKPLSKIEKGKWEEICHGQDVVVIATGKMVSYAMLAKEKLDFTPTIVNACFIKPLDYEYLKKVAKQNINVLTLEDNNLAGGFGESVLTCLNELGFVGQIKMMGYPDKFIDHGSISELLEELEMDPESIKKEIEKLSSK